MSAPLVPVSLGSPDVRAADVHGFRVLGAAFPAGLSLPQHVHDRATLAIVLDGGFRKELARGVQECRPCSVIGEPAGERHSNCWIDAGRLGLSEGNATMNESNREAEVGSRS
jgi:hypothetical protein